VLEGLGWSGDKPVAAVAVELSPDNKHITRAQFLLRGPLSDSSSCIPANKIWPNAGKDVMLQLQVPDGETFQFNSGTLASDPVACENVKFYFQKSDRTIPPPDWSDNGLGEFVLRTICHLGKNSNKREGPSVKFTVILIPSSVEDLKKLEPASRSAAWPGARVAEGNCPLFPGEDTNTWEDPVCPLIYRGSHASEAPNLPKGAEVRFHVAAVMRTARVAVTCASAASLRKKAETAASDVASLEKEPLITWPHFKRPEPEKGEFTTPLIFLNLFFLTLSVAISGTVPSQHQRYSN
jgi:hypothetical protein